MKLKNLTDQEIIFLRTVNMPISEIPKIKLTILKLLMKKQRKLDGLKKDYAKFFKMRESLGSQKNQNTTDYEMGVRLAQIQEIKNQLKELEKLITHG